MIRKLIDKNAKLDIINIDNMTPLDYGIVS